MNNSEKGSFYNEEGQIKDVKNAEELAYIEKEKGRDAALARERRLKEIAEKGFDDEVDEFYVPLMERLQQKYPDAFEERIEQDGRKVLRVLRSHSDSKFIFTERGLISYDYSGDFYWVDDKGISYNEEGENARKCAEEGMHGYGSRLYPACFCFYHDVSKFDNSTLEGLKEMFEKSQKYGLKIKQAEEVLAQKKNVDKLMELL